MLTTCWHCTQTAAHSAASGPVSKRVVSDSLPTTLSFPERHESTKITLAVLLSTICLVTSMMWFYKFGLVYSGTFCFMFSLPRTHSNTRGEPSTPPGRARQTYSCGHSARRRASGAHRSPRSPCGTPSVPVVHEAVQGNSSTGSQFPTAAAAAAEQQHNNDDTTTAAVQATAKAMQSAHNTQKNAARGSRTKTNLRAFQTVPFGLFGSSRRLEPPEAPSNQPGSRLNREGARGGACSATYAHARYW